MNGWTRGHKKPIEKIDRSGNVVKKYSSAIEAARDNYTTYPVIIRHCDQKAKRPIDNDGSSFRYAGDESGMPWGENVIMYSFYNMRDNRPESGLYVGISAALRDIVAENIGDENIRYLRVQSVPHLGGVERDGQIEIFDRRTGAIIHADDL